MSVIPLKNKATALLFAVLLLANVIVPVDAEPFVPGDSAESTAILDRYLHATQDHDNTLRGASMQVDIDASVPKLKEIGKLQALRKISKVGQITYRVLSFQGDNTVKNQVIARYLQAEQQGQGDSDIAITPKNYKFKYRGQKSYKTGANAYVFQLAPVKKRVGLFKGELWLDANSYLPLMEKGRLVKNPSIFFKQVDFERGFSIKDGRSLPAYINSTIDTRLIGKVELNVNFSKIEQDTNEAGEANAAILASYSPGWVR